MSDKISLKEELVQTQILQGAKKLLATYGVAKVTMDDVARVIGKTRGAIYYYYKSKDEIVDAVIEMEIKDVRSAMEDAVNQASNAISKINAFFTSKLKLGREKYIFFDALENGMDANSMSNFKHTQKKHHDRTLKWEGDLLSVILMEGIKNKELRMMDQEAMDSLIFVLLSTLHGLKREMRMENNIREIGPVIDQLINVIIHGFAIS